MKRTCVRMPEQFAEIGRLLTSALAQKGVPIVQDVRDAEVVVTYGTDNVLSALEECRGQVIQMFFDRRDRVENSRVTQHDFIQPTDNLVARLE